MDYQRPQRVSVLDPIEQAIGYTRQMLFTPFDLSKWFVVGFCAWLAYLGSNSWPNFNFNFPDRYNHFGLNDIEFSAIRDAIMPNLFWILIGAAVLIPFIIAITIVIYWLNSRGQFMFVHCIAGNIAEISVPWKKFSRHGNSLFIFKLALCIVSFLLIAILVAPIIISVASFKSGLTGLGLAGLTAAGACGFIIVVALALVAKFTNDFVVPIMFLQTSSVTAGWKMFLSILSVNKARLLLYILFQIVISIIVGSIIFMICIVGCCFCCASILLFVPYIGTVILLPLFVFKKAYSLFYLKQFGAQFDVFIKPV